MEDQALTIYQLVNYLSAQSLGSYKSLLTEAVFVAVIEQKNLSTLQQNLKTILEKNYLQDMLDELIQITTSSQVTKEVQETVQNHKGESDDDNDEEKTSTYGINT